MPYIYKNETGHSLSVPRYNSSDIEVPKNYYVKGSHYNTFHVADGVTTATRLYQLFGLTNVSADGEPPASMVLYNWDTAENSIIESNADSLNLDIFENVDEDGTVLTASSAGDTVYFVSGDTVTFTADDEEKTITLEVTPAGTDKQLQFNDGGTLAGAAAEWDADASTLTVDGTIIVDNLFGIAGSALQVLASSAEATADSQAGVDIQIVASNATAGTTNAGGEDGGTVVIRAGDADRKTSGDGDGGNIEISVGSGIGSGSFGNVSITGNTTVTGDFTATGAASLVGPFILTSPKLATGKLKVYEEEITLNALTNDSSANLLPANSIICAVTGYLTQAITGGTHAKGTISLTGISVEDQNFVVGAQTFTWKTLRAGTGEVTIGVDAAASCTNIIAAITADLATVTATQGAGTTVVVTAVTGGSAGNSILFTAGTSANLTVDGAGTLGATTAGATATGWKLSDPTTAGRFSTNDATLTLGHSHVGLLHMAGGISTDATGPVQVAAAKARVTVAGGIPDTGKCRVSVFALEFTPATS
jgi:hypothetical protein